MTARRARPGALLVVALALLGLATWPVPALADTGVALPGVVREGRADIGDPVEVSAGSWRGSIGPGETGSRYYTYRRTLEDSSVLLGVLASTTSGESEGVSVSAETLSGDDCGSDTASAFGTDALGFGAGLWVGGDPEEAVAEGDEPDPCLVGETLVIEVGRGFSSASGDLDVALTIIEEAPVADTTELPASAELSAFTPPEVDGSPQELAGGSFLEPTTITSPSSSQGTLTTGSAVVYRVPVDWGQTLNARVAVNAIGEIGSGSVVVRILDPRYASELTDVEDGNLSSTDDTTATAVSGPVRYLNRIDSDAPFVPGDFYVLVAAAPLSDAEQIDVPFTLQVEVTGDPAGVPNYPTDTPFITADGTTGGVIAQPGATPGWTFARAAAVAGLVLLGVLSLGGGLTLLRRR